MGRKRGSGHGPKLNHFTPINLDDALNAAVTKECVKRNDSISNTIRNILREYFDLPTVNPMRKSRRAELLMKQAIAKIGKGE